MRIAHLISRFFPEVGGAQICIHNIAKRQAGAGNNVVVITPYEFRDRGENCYKKEVLLPATQALLRKSRFLGRHFLFSQLQCLQNKHKFDIWQVTIGFPLGIFAVDFFRNNSIPCILRCVGFDIQTMPDIGYGVRLDKKADADIRESYKLYDALVANSTAMLQEYRALGIPEEKIHRIPNGIDYDRFNKDFDRETQRRSLGLESGKKLIISVGRNHPKKGFWLIPELIKGILQKRDDFSWLIVGDGSGEIKEAGKKIGVGEYIIARPNIGLNKGQCFRPESRRIDYPTQELIDLYKTSDLFVFPTFIEGFSTVMVEAMAAGLPVVTTEAPGVDEIVRNGVTGLKSAVQDRTKMIENICRLLEKDEFYHSLKQNAFLESANYDWGKINQKYMDLYSRLAKK